MAIKTYAINREDFQSEMSKKLFEHSDTCFIAAMAEVQEVVRLLENSNVGDDADIAVTLKGVLEGVPTRLDPEIQTKVRSHLLNAGGNLLLTYVANSFIISSGEDLEAAVAAGVSKEELPGFLRKLAMADDSKTN